MATQEQIKALKIAENVFEQREDTEQDLKCYEGEPVTNRSGSHLHYFNEKKLSLQSRSSLFFLLLHPSSEFFLSRVIDGIVSIE